MNKIFIGMNASEHMLGGMHRGPICSSSDPTTVSIGVRLTFVSKAYKLLIRGWISGHAYQGMQLLPSKNRVKIK
jgi:hypothetical protein